MEKKLKFIEETLSIYNQEQLLRFYNELNENQKNNLLNQIETINFEQIKELYKQTQIKDKLGDVKIEKIDYIDKYNLPEEKRNSYITAGTDAILKGKLAVVTMAGGQGTRLGHDGPKGTFDIGLPSKKSIFEILCDKFKDVQGKYGVTIPWYIMTSKSNNKETVAFFEKNNYFNYPKEKIKFFIQNEIPMIDFNGKMLLSEKGCVKEGADGHGGIFTALHKFNLIKDMSNQGIEWVFIGGVDNILAQIADSLLIGAAIVESKEVACKTVEKAYETEKVGVFAKKNGKVGIVEYTEISEELASRKDENGKFVYGDTNILCNLFNIRVLEKSEEVKLPYHVAVKKTEYIDENGKRVYPEEPNAYKFESFFFDALETVDNVIIVRGKREEEFSPIKNATGVDSPETARKLYMDYQKKLEEKDTNEDRSSESKMDVKINKEIFRAYDIRGIVGEDLNKEFAEVLGKAFGSYIQKYNQKQVIVGHDCRESSDELREGLIEGIISTGVNVLNIGMATTPMVYYARKLLKVGPAIQITASHSPREYNGFKMCIEEDAESIFGDRISEVYEFLVKGEFLSGLGKVEKVSIDEQYIEEIASRIEIPNKNVKVVIDCGNATPAIIAERVFKRLGVEVVPLFCEIDSSFPNHHPDPSVAENMVDLSVKVREVKADVGFAFDGDCDRIGVVDEKGQMILGDEYMRIMWREVIRNYPGSKALVEIKCSQSLWDELEELGAKPEFIRTGNPHIKAAMKEKDVPLSGEMSGHIMFKDEYYGFDDGLYAAARFLRMMCRENKKVSEMLGAPKYVSTQEIPKPVDEKEKFAIIEKAINYFKSLGLKVIDVDGARVIFNDGWGLIRASNTAPKLTLRFEAKNQPALEKIQKEFDTMFDKIM